LGIILTWTVIATSRVTGGPDSAVNGSDDVFNGIWGMVKNDGNSEFEMPS
jgi:hypothetical protein